METTYEVFDNDNSIIYMGGLSYETAMAVSLSYDEAGFNTDIRQEPGNTDEYLILI